MGRRGTKATEAGAARLRAACAAAALAALAAAGPAAGAAGDSPRLDAETWFLQDFHTGRVLAEERAGERREPASLVKLMTVYVTLAEIARGGLGLADEVPVSREAWRMGGSQMFLEVSTKTTVEQALKGIIVQSGNDASVAIAERVAGTEEAFVGLMNEQAERLGMDGTRYGNAHGLSHPQNYTTARDTATLLRALMRDFPEVYLWHSLPEFTYNGITQPNRNRLLRSDPTVDGGKTGYTKNAGYCLAVSANRNGMRLVAVVMGAPSSPERFRAASTLFGYGYRNYLTSLVFAAKEPVREATVWSGAAESVRVGLARDLWVTMARRDADRLRTRTFLDDPVVAPVQEGGALGRMELALGERTFAERELVALSAVSEGSLYRRVVDWFRLLWH